MKCPNCYRRLKMESTSCVCGWSVGNRGSKKCECAVSGCMANATIRQKMPTGWADFCEFHALEKHQERAEKFCRDNGLDTVEKQKAFCRSTAKKPLGPSFEGWCRTMKQVTVDFIARSNGRDDLKLLERLRDLGVIDGRNQVIRLEDRAIAAEAQRRERAHRIVQAEEELKASEIVLSEGEEELVARGLVQREPGEDEQEAA